MQVISRHKEAEPGQRSEPSVPTDLHAVATSSSCFDIPEEQVDVLCLFGGWDCKSDRRLADVTCVSLSGSSRWQSWRLGALPNNERLDRASALLAEGDIVFVVGGERKGGTVSPSTFIFEIAKSRWLVGPKLQTCSSGESLRY
ncbi:unnamed protein product [Protopolystoma xenopodis]|uniref:Uncharacterized protein n=1 Tax=Protopolystoma xenopodis TaxID=117903 RepID=A0A3S4ZE61_9PLAT|nr:unnamed protein product [Protopolystoma xenopodis]